MLKITSGIFGGQSIAQPKTTLTRPVSEQTRHAIFQVLGDVEGLTVLDLFAGSGALGLEALSLGASSAVFVDSGQVAVEAIKTSIHNLKVTSTAKVVKSSVEKFLETNTEKFDLIFFDPPYAKFGLDSLKQVSNHLNPTGIIIVSCSAKTELPHGIDHAEQIKQKIYGDTQITYYHLKKT